MNDDLWKGFADQDFPRFKVSNRDQALFLIRERDLEAQLLAIRGALSRNQQSDAAVAAEIKELDEQIRTYAGGDQRYQMYLQDQWIDALHDTAFQDAAHSMAAVGMLAPFVESLFVSIFRGLREYGQSNNNVSSDDPKTAASSNEAWDPQSEFDHQRRRRGVVNGILHVSSTTGLAKYLPSSYDKTLNALFAYRNKMFHLGFEWPKDKRMKFDRRVRSDEWPAEWFRKATRGDKPWIFYLSDEFITHCLKTIDEVLEGVGAYFRERQGLT